MHKNFDAKLHTYMMKKVCYIFTDVTHHVKVADKIYYCLINRNKTFSFNRSTSTKYIPFGKLLILTVV